MRSGIRNLPAFHIVMGGRIGSSITSSGKNQREVWMEEGFRSVISSA